jgi:hypothetical protein
MAGDPKALEFMLSTTDSQGAFLKLAPMAMNKFEELNPEGYASYLCQRIVGDAVANDVPVSMKLAQHFLAAGDTAKAAEEFGKVVSWFQGLDATAKKPATAPQPTKPAANEDPRFKELEQRDIERTRSDWSQESSSQRSQIYVTELNRLLAGRKITDNQREDIESRVRMNLEKRTKEISSVADKYFAVRDKDGFLKYDKTFAAKHIPELLREAVDRYVTAKPGPKPGTQQQNGKPVTPPIKATDGFTRVQQMPSREQIDWGNPFNSLSNIKLGKAITVDGKKVQWR